MAWLVSDVGWPDMAMSMALGLTSPAIIHNKKSYLLGREVDTHWFVTNIDWNMEIMGINHGFLDYA